MGLERKKKLGRYQTCGDKACETEKTKEIKTGTLSRPVDFICL